MSRIIVTQQLLFVLSCFLRILFQYCALLYCIISIIFIFNTRLMCYNNVADFCFYYYEILILVTV